MDLNYLNQEIKNKYLYDLSSEECEIDVDIKQYINTINSFPFVCTTQCCQGHPNDGYLSIMIYEAFSLWMEKEVIKEVIIYCEDIYKYFEHIGNNSVNIRYVFRFKNYKDFFELLIKNLSTYQWIGVQ